MPPRETYTPTVAMKRAALRAQKMREAAPPSDRAMTATGLARMRQLINREALSYATVKRMLAFFERHDGTRPEGDASGSKWEQAWLGWGGNAAWGWARRIVRAVERARDAMKRRRAA